MSTGLKRPPFNEANTKEPFFWGAGDSCSLLYDKSQRAAVVNRTPSRSFLCLVVRGQRELKLFQLSIWNPVHSVRPSIEEKPYRSKAPGP